MNKQRDVRQDALAMWIHSLRPWEDFFTITFRRPVGLYAVSVRVKEGLLEYARGASFFFAVERNPGRPGYHSHGVLHGLRVERRELWKALFKACGRTEITPCRSKGDVLSYCAKYLTKESGWWDYHLAAESARRAL